GRTERHPRGANAKREKNGCFARNAVDCEQASCKVIEAGAENASAPGHAGRAARACARGRRAPPPGARRGRGRGRKTGSWGSAESHVGRAARVRDGRRARPPAVWRWRARAPWSVIGSRCGRTRERESITGQRKNANVPRGTPPCSLTSTRNRTEVKLPGFRV